MPVGLAELQQLRRRHPLTETDTRWFYRSVAPGLIKAFFLWLDQIFLTVPEGDRPQYEAIWRDCQHYLITLSPALLEVVADSHDPDGFVADLLSGPTKNLDNRPYPIPAVVPSVVKVKPSAEQLNPDAFRESILTWLLELLLPRNWTKTKELFFFRSNDGMYANQLLLPQEIQIDDQILTKMFGSLLVSSLSTEAGVKDFYDALAVSYNGLADSGFKEQIAHQVMGAFPTRKQFPILDLGCGTGLLHRQFPHLSITGIDISRLMSQQAKEAGATVVQGSIQHLPFATNSFRRAAMLFVEHYITDWPLFLSELNRVLRPRSIFICTVRRPSGDWQGYYEGLLSKNGFARLTFWSEVNKLMTGEFVRTGFIRALTQKKNP